MQQSTHSKPPPPLKQPLRARMVTLIAHTRTLAFRVSRHRLLLRLLLLSCFVVLAAWVIFYRFLFQQSFALPGTAHPQHNCCFCVSHARWLHSLLTLLCSPSRPHARQR
jgi:hypothetical protein